ncbi:MAG: CDP-alcohol phosphatidyltransferase family protein [Prevotella sp.]|nr:CDP-alcohol phosphatidyltransferase family protein [Prevotella sp.]
MARIAGSLGLLLYDVMGLAYWIVYALCGISDIADGWLARKLKCVTKNGALLDSVADICFVACCAWKLLPILELPLWLWLWGGVIVAIKIVNQISALVMYGRCCFLHALANKATGFLLFIAVPMTFLSIIPIAIVASVATLAAIQEGHFIRTRRYK